MSEANVPTISLWARLMHLIGREKAQSAPSEPGDKYSTEKVLAMAKRVATKTVVWERGTKHIGLLMVEQLPIEGGGIISAEKLQFMKRWTESTEQDPLMILFLLDCPEWNNPYPITNFDNHLDWMFAKDGAQKEAYMTWKRGLLRRP